MQIFRCILHHLLRTVAAGSHLVHMVYNDVNLIGEVIDHAGSIAQRGGQYLNSKAAPKVAQGDLARAGKYTGQAITRALKYGEAVAWYALYRMCTYPVSALVFIYWQKGVTIVAFLVIPSLLAVWATIHALGNRNYFATYPEEYEGVSIAGGPVDYSTDEDDEDDDDDYSSEYEAEPLQSGRHRRKDTMSQITVVQAENPNSRRNNRHV